MNRCQYCGQYAGGDNLICDRCREDKSKEEEDSDLTNPHFEDEENDWGKDLQEPYDKKLDEWDKEEDSADDGSLDIEEEGDNWLSGLDRVVKPKEKSYE